MTGPLASETLAGLPQDVRAALAAVDAVLLDVDGVLTDGRIHVHADGAQSLSFDVRDGSGLWLLHRAGVKLAVVTGRESGVPEHYLADYPVHVILAGRRDKAQGVADALAELGVGPERAAFVGDDIVDGPALRAVGAPLCVADSVPELKPLAIHVTRAPGGRGAVREIADLILEARGDRQRLLARFLGEAADTDPAPDTDPAGGAS